MKGMLAGQFPGGFGVDYPLVLALLFLISLPLLNLPLLRQRAPSLALAPPDQLSRIVAGLLRVSGMVAIAALVLALAGLHRREQTVERQGHGANIVLLFDRSSSMDNTFAETTPTGGEESKSHAAKRLLSEFVARREHDRIGVVAFSTSPMPVLPLTDHHGAVQAAIAAIDRPALSYTDVGRGLAMALTRFDAASENASRALLLVSDGAAVIDQKVQEFLRDEILRNPVHLYWLFLRSKGAPSIFAPAPIGDDTPQAYPERHLHLFMKSLGVPYRAFEAESPQAVEQAIAEIDRQETHPLLYEERVPRQDYARLLLVVAILALGLLLSAKLAERPFERPLRATPVAPGRAAHPVRTQDSESQRRAA
ncbi:VWA domain-containing protein [Ancylobacter sp. 6x-1]|uniref:VWA domain-containing protein n=1 Tax=Ancylobacter crimeensis TaxID=2579147 RepID=A0ABT0DDC0_9HYPH|nr:vWA domain-containing protein [Ancylobacter crimeensis]MCK0197952.1 VWA domain-containing protein [Ancylobacter crimeensis]